ncbi:NADP-dependent phosphogluconate dehydrogenase [Salegentibacter salegens]|uniref:6-phosphogluconate dehydrogenase, decarboxylating n=1 Tax=Salegentibacter salegens TaxID=143223 RepID=A0A1M7IX55_9FLAO|nr:NADP-dependent phosphogluconate dehydrogenase [Salegentibacter salegens]PRX49839.1 6-phosphogluconate dehydrogenase [Salegentibacter salegens]SHM45255.1 6-phosphogluconate dehydrogenase [Salegentibacter salegens]
MAVYIVMGVSGSGKTTIGKLLAKDLNLSFYDADDFHPPENVEKMKNGIPLQDEDRKGWLAVLAENIQKWNKQDGAVLACSALKEKYRKQLTSIPEKDLKWIFLWAEFDVILKRLKNRKSHYFKPEMLTSQFETLEEPNCGIRINVNTSEENILKEIMAKLNAPEAEVGLIGLGVMGKSLALNLLSKNIEVSVFNRHITGKEEDVAKDFVQQNAEKYTFQGFDDLKEFVSSLKRPRKILLMVNAGAAVDAVIESLLPLLEKGDIITDGGNSHYKDTFKRELALRENGIDFIGCGISGGEEGALKGPSIMPGGSAEAYKQMGPFLKTIAAKDKNGNPCCTHIGEDGAGHFVKMVHNGIEYGEMQLIAEIYHFLRFYTKSSPEAIADLFESWNKEMKSYLLEISIDILRKKENSGFLIDKILDAAKQKGTGGWSTNAALELGVPLDTITAAVLARNISGMKNFRVEASNLYNITNNQDGNIEEIKDEMFLAYKTASIINHAIGYDLLRVASVEYNWKLNLSEISRVWTNGCIIRSGLMEELVDIFENSNNHLLMNSDIISEIKGSQAALSKTVGISLQAGYAVPVLSAATNYFLNFTSAQNAANMIQSQRDYFGAHTYERTDKPRGDFFHTQWKNNN